MILFLTLLKDFNVLLDGIIFYTDKQERFIHRELKDLNLVETSPLWFFLPIFAVVSFQDLKESGKISKCATKKVKKVYFKRRNG